MRLFLIVILAAGLCSCGQKGPLQRPDQTALHSDVRVVINADTAVS
jgi:predicted small lipoprotein YifL